MCSPSYPSHSFCINPDHFQHLLIFDWGKMVTIKSFYVNGVRSSVPLFSVSAGLSGWDTSASQQTSSDLLLETEILPVPWLIPRLAQPIMVFLFFCIWQANVNSFVKRTLPGAKPLKYIFCNLSDLLSGPRVSHYWE